MALTRDEILTSRPVPQEEVQAFGGTVIVRGMTARGRSEFERQLRTKSGKQDEKKTGEIRERLVVACVVDDSGSPVFTEDDIPAIGEMAASSLEPIVDVAMRLCGMSTGDVESMAKNSQPTADD